MSRMVNYALIMAGGRGVRLMPITDTMPKAMVPYNGSTLIAVGIDKIRKHIPNIYITVGYIIQLPVVIIAKVFWSD